MNWLAMTSKLLNIAQPLFATDGYMAGVGSSVQPLVAHDGSLGPWGSTLVYESAQKILPSIRQSSKLN